MQDWLARRKEEEVRTLNSLRRDRDVRGGQIATVRTPRQGPSCDIGSNVLHFGCSGSSSSACSTGGGPGSFGDGSCGATLGFFHQDGSFSSLEGGIVSPR